MANVYDIIIRPVITERSMAATSDKKYVFEVAPTAGKIEIKDAVELAAKGLDPVPMVRADLARAPRLPRITSRAMAARSSPTCRPRWCAT